MPENRIAERLDAHCLAHAGAVKGQPFRYDGVFAFTVAGKIFAILRPDHEPPRISLKGDPDESERLRATYPAITPGYRLNKRHWNTVLLDGSVPAELVLSLVDDSYDLVLASLTRAQRANLR